MLYMRWIFVRLTDLSFDFSSKGLCYFLAGCVPAEWSHLGVYGFRTEDVELKQDLKAPNGNDSNL